MSFADFLQLKLGEHITENVNLLLKNNINLRIISIFNLFIINKYWFSISAEFSKFEISRNSKSNKIILKRIYLHYISS